MFPLLGSLISGGASLLGGLMNSSSQQAINSQNIAMQEDFAQNGIQWKVADARKAGINPLAALGAQTASFANNVGSDAMGNSVASAGQDVGRAVAAQSTADDRMFQEQQRAQQLQHGDLQNALLASQIRTLNQPGNPPPMPSSGQRYVLDGQAPTAVPGTSSTVEVVPQKVTAEAPGGAVRTAGVAPEVSLVNTASGGVMPMPSKDFQGASFGSDVSSFGWDVRNIVGPMLSSRAYPNLPAPKPGYNWTFDPVQGYTQVPVLFDVPRAWDWLKRHDEYFVPSAY